MLCKLVKEPHLSRCIHVELLKKSKENKKKYDEEVCFIIERCMFLIIPLMLCCCISRGFVTTRKEHMAITSLFTV